MIDKRIQLFVHVFMLFISIEQGIGIAHVFQFDDSLSITFVVLFMCLVGTVLSRVIIRTLEIPIYHDKYVRERRKRQKGYDREYELNKKRSNTWYVGINEEDE